MFNLLINQNKNDCWRLAMKGLIFVKRTGYLCHKCCHSHIGARWARPQRLVELIEMDAHHTVGRVLGAIVHGRPLLAGCWALLSMDAHRGQGAGRYCPWMPTIGRVLGAIVYERPPWAGCLVLLSMDTHRVQSAGRYCP